MQTLQNDLRSAVSLKKNVVCFRSSRTSIPPKQVCDWNEKGGGAAGGGELQEALNPLAQEHLGATLGTRIWFSEFNHEQK